MEPRNPPHFTLEPPTPPGREELLQKHQRVKNYLDQNGLDGIWLATTANIAWYTGGGEVYIGIASLTGACALLITREEVMVWTDAIEAPKLENEAFKQYLAVAPVPVKFEVRRWYDNLWIRVGRVAAGWTLGSDDPATPGLLSPDSRLAEVSFKLLGADFLRLRYCLTPGEADRYRWVGRRAAAAIERAAAEVRQGQSELEVAALLNRAVTANGLVPVLALIAADERIGAYRHPLPTPKAIDRVCMLVTGARGGGLICSATRLIHFGPLSAELRRKHEAVVQVDGALLAASRPGATAADLFDTAKSAYAEQGFPGEEEKHHQGGATGYAARDYKCEPHGDKPLYESQAVAWNPSIAGTKSEDTYLVAEAGRDGEALECLSRGLGQWPLRKVVWDGRTFYRPEILIR